MEKRTTIDRRSIKLPPIKYLLFGGRRKTIRRSENKTNVFYLDTYTSRTFIIILIIFILSIVDGFLTLHLADQGATEVNPIMAFFIQFGIYPFVFAKIALTFIGLICLLVLNGLYLKSLRTYVKNLYSVFIGLYSGAIIWQIYIKFY